MTERPRLLYLITEDWYFWSHRLDLARAAMKAGFEVTIATRVTKHGERIRQEGFRLLPISLVRRSMNPFSEMVAALELLRLYRRERPMIAHHVALKPIMYGALAAWLAGVPIVVNAFAGLGYAFTDRRRHSGFLGGCLRRALRILLRLSRSIVVFQNREDRDLLMQEGVISEECAKVIPGSGVDTDVFTARCSSAGVPIVMLASRMLWDKGIAEFVGAARSLRRQGVTARFVLVGRCDEHNPAAIDPRSIQEWIGQGVVEWWGHRDDMADILADATVVVLPSYREGLPKVLLEAAACGKPLVATDVPGCRDVVMQGVNGLLVPPRDDRALASAIQSLLSDASLRAKMGVAGRELVVRSFSVAAVATQVVDLYQGLLARSQHAAEAAGSV